jgi:hypothetical protein
VGSFRPSASVAGQGTPGFSENAFITGVGSPAVEKGVIWSRQRPTIAEMVLKIRMSYPRRIEGFREVPIRFWLFNLRTEKLI